MLIRDSRVSRRWAITNFALRYYRKHRITTYIGCSTLQHVRSCKFYQEIYVATKQVDNFLRILAGSVASRRRKQEEVPAGYFQGVTFPRSQLSSRCETLIPRGVIIGQYSTFFVDLFRGVERMSTETTREDVERQQLFSVY